MKSIVTALRTLTILPVPGTDTSDFPTAMPFFPLVGLLFSGIVAAAAWIVHQSGIDAPGVFAVLTIVAVLSLTGWLHVDGLGDVADAFGGGKDRETVLRILKDSRMGTFGIAAVVSNLLIRTTCWTWYFDHKVFWPILVSFVISRAFQGLVLSFVPYARPKGTAAPFSTVGLGPRIRMILSTVVFCGIPFLFLPPLAYFGVLLCSAVVAAAFITLCRRRIGGITGDCVGATGELVEMAAVVVGVILTGAF